MKLDNQERLFEDIYTDIQRYKSLLDVLVKYDRDFAKKQGDIFNMNLMRFKHFYGEDTEEDEFSTQNDSDLPTKNSLDSTND